MLHYSTASTPKDKVHHILFIGLDQVLLLLKLTLMQIPGTFRPKE